MYTELELQMMYRSNKDSLVQDFYLPALMHTKMYKRAVGYFSSTALIEMSIGICDIARRGGKIQIIASPELSHEDIEAINNGYKKRKEVLENRITKNILEHTNYYDLERLNLIEHLIANGTLEFKIAVADINKKMGIYHEKIGVMRDSVGNTIAFTGSANESANAFKNNFESILVFKSWEEHARVRCIEENFARLWEDATTGVKVLDFTEELYKKLLKYKKNDYTLELDKYQFENKVLEQKNINMPRKPEWLKLHDYQSEAIEQWKQNDYRGIFNMATGTGKTLTGLSALERLAGELDNELVVLIVCPYQHLVEQWVEDIAAFSIQPIIGYSNSKQKKWKEELRSAIFRYNLKARKFVCFISTNATFSSNYVQEQIGKIKGDTLLIVDEAHNFGANRLQECLDEKIKYRLALSATLDRHRDEVGTQKLKSYFGEECIEYTLERAIKEQKLTPYRYYPIVVSLNEQELENYQKITREMIKACRVDKSGKLVMTDRAKLIAIKRARIVAGASEKLNKLLECIRPYQEESHMLIYCGATQMEGEGDIYAGDIRQIDYVCKALYDTYDMKISQFTSQEDMREREIIKRDFDIGEDLQAIVAIKCLDEGVNIPKIKTAFILASSTNPKEYIQRRGRILRKSPNKQYAEIFDFVTLPRPIEDICSYTKEEVEGDKGLVRNELARIKEFAKLALNPADSYELIETLIDSYELDNLIEEDLYGEGC